MRLNCRGDGTIGAVIGAIMTISALSIGSMLLFHFVAFGHSQTQRIASSSLVRALRQQTASESDGASAVFIPTSDIFGAPNTVAYASPDATPDGSVIMPASAAHEFDIVRRDLSGSPRFTAYYFAGNTLEKIAYYTRTSSGQALCSSSVPCTAANASVEWSGSARSFNAAYLKASQLSQVNPFIAASGQTIPDITVPLGFSSDILAGNRMVVYQIDASPPAASTTYDPHNSNGASYARDQVQLAAGVAVTGGFSSNVQFTPPPIGGMTVPASLTVAYGASQPFSASVTNYHHGFTVGACSNANISASGPAIQSADNAANNPPTSFPGTWQQYMANGSVVGTCTATISTQSGLSAPDNIVQSANITITVTGSLNAAPLSMVFPSPTSTPAPVSVSEPGYNGAFTVTSNCNGYASVSGGGAGPTPAPYLVTPQASTLPLPGSLCTITFVDSVSPSTDKATVTVTVDPTPSCTRDAFGNCATMRSRKTLSTATCTQVIYWPSGGIANSKLITYPTSWSTTYDVWGNDGNYALITENGRGVPDSNCPPAAGAVDTWSPWEPAVHYNDSNLP